MSCAELQRYLHAQIPLSAAMAVAVSSVAEEAVTLRAPLAPNINHRDTVFGGSACAVAMLAAWSLLHVRLRALGAGARLVIQRHTMEYLHPMAGEFTARSALQHPERWPQFTRTLARRGRARIGVAVLLEEGGVAAARFCGEFVALREE
jgi:thioesterase domain-containing protein